jgi:ATP-dependent Clp protease adaptor protein ClpS
LRVTAVAYRRCDACCGTIRLMTAPILAADTSTVLEEVELERPQVAPRWIVIVWNDPINLMTYVTFVFRKLFGYSQAHAQELMLKVHFDGRAVVSGGTQERCEYDVTRLHAHGLWATMQEE